MLEDGQHLIASDALLHTRKRLRQPIEVDVIRKEVATTHRSGRASYCQSTINVSGVGVC